MKQPSVTKQVEEIVEQFLKEMAEEGYGVANAKVKRIARDIAFWLPKDQPVDREEVDRMFNELDNEPGWEAYGIEYAPAEDE